MCAVVSMWCRSKFSLRRGRAVEAFSEIAPRSFRPGPFGQRPAVDGQVQAQASLPSILTAQTHGIYWPALQYNRGRGDSQVLPVHDQNGCMNCAFTGRKLALVVHEAAGGERKKEVQLVRQVQEGRRVHWSASAGRLEGQHCSTKGGQQLEGLLPVVCFRMPKMYEGASSVLLTEQKSMQGL